MRIPSVAIELDPVGRALLASFTEPVPTDIDWDVLHAELNVRAAFALARLRTESAPAEDSLGAASVRSAWDLFVRAASIRARRWTRE
ncbi:MAG: hypothetical protein M3081_07575 [Gemmatimonadota bacterium]|nr:hypothetical protein [Gemmatimonadota bacterium]